MTFTSLNFLNEYVIVANDIHEKRTYDTIFYLALLKVNFITSLVSGQGHRIAVVCVCLSVCLCMSILPPKPFDL